jgi:N-acetylglucosaminyl-diphospho-decaprenol L-rhamnosyltransferase
VSLCIVILNFRTPTLCIDAIASAVPQARFHGSTEIIIVDGGSGDGSVSILQAAIDERDCSDVVTLLTLQENHGFAAGNDAAITRLLELKPECKLIWLLNPDTLLHMGALKQLLNALDENPSWGIVGSRLEDPAGTSQNAARQFPGVFNELDSTARFGPVSRCLKLWQIAPHEQDKRATCDWLPGASLMIRREVFESIGLLDEGFFMYFEEVDFCKRAKDAGFKVGYVPSSRVVHLVGQASGVTSSGGTIKKRRPQYWFDSRARYFLRHHGRLGLLAANMAWLCGQSMYHTLRIARRRPNEDPPYLVWDFVRHMLCRSTWKRPGPPIYPDFMPNANGSDRLTA